MRAAQSGVLAFQPRHVFLLLISRYQYLLLFHGRAANKVVRRHFTRVYRFWGREAAPVQFRRGVDVTAKCWLQQLVRTILDFE